MTYLPYDPKKALFLAFPEMKRLSKQVNDVMEGAEETLSEREFAGCDTSWARDRLYEAEWRINCTSDYTAAFCAWYQSFLFEARPLDGPTPGQAMAVALAADFPRLHR
jgi:hypothetical protein